MKTVKFDENLWEIKATWNVDKTRINWIEEVARLLTNEF